MQVHIVSEVPYPLFICDGSQNLEPLEPEPPSALFRAATLFVSPATSLTGQPPPSSPELRRLALRIVFSSVGFAVVPNVQALECRYTQLEKEVYARLSGWR